ncbi:MAG: hypothetical protein M5U14_12950 [Acidimicrobiia bacterium]|nr:hypothetical protein [Acidimicrobiia bacterium]
MRARLVTVVLASAGLLVALAAVASAQVTGGCTATIDGQDLDAARSARDAIEVDHDATVTVVGTAPGPIESYRVYLKFGPFRFQAAEGDVESGETTYTDSVDVGDYAIYGVGLYRVEGETTGTPCSAWGYVKVTGRFPLFTVAGAVGGVLTVGGVAGMASSWPRRPGRSV